MRSPAIGEIKLFGDTRRHRPETHGIYGAIGPKGCGKSLLFVYLAHKYVETTFTPETCPCRDRKRKDHSWTVYTNMRSASTGEGAWARPLDILGDMIDAESPVDHAIMLVDEAYLMADSRRAMRTSNMEIARFVTQLRKRSVKMFLTLVNLNSLDRRLRELMTRIYDCWTPNEGRTVCAAVFRLAQGDRPRFMRHRRPTFRSWRTQGAWKLYDSMELFDSADMTGYDRETSIMQLGKDGQPMTVMLGDAVAQIVHKMVAAGVREADPWAIQATLQDRADAPMPIAEIKQWFSNAGFRAIQDGSRGGIQDEVYVIASRGELVEVG